MSERYEFVVNLAREAGEKILVLKEQGMEISNKGGDPRDLVTNVDIEISNFITEKINEKFPSETIYSEEAPDVDISSASLWTIDPVDGTAHFSRNIPHFSVVIAYVEKGVPSVGAIYNPVTKEMFSFEKDRGAFLNNNQVHVSSVKTLSGAHVFIHAGRKQELWDWGANAYKFLLSKANKTSNFGSSALDICFVGTGRIEACIYGSLTAVDIAAAFGFIKEAGGFIVGTNGNFINALSNEKQKLVAVNNEEILSEIKSGIVI